MISEFNSKGIHKLEKNNKAKFIIFILRSKFREPPSWEARWSLEIRVVRGCGLECWLDCLLAVRLRVITKPP
jgi:hypothetical protein